METTTPTTAPQFKNQATSQISKAMKSLLILPILALACCKPSENVGNVKSNYVMDENGATLTIREIYLDGKCFYASQSSKGCWVLGPEKK